jgi:hypothetical protein
MSRGEGLAVGCPARALAFASGKREKGWVVPSVSERGGCMTVRKMPLRWSHEVR